MFDKLKYLFSFNWFYIVLFLILALFTFGDEFIVGGETLKLIIKNNYGNENNGYSEMNSSNYKLDFMDSISTENDITVCTYDIEYIFFHPLILNSEKFFDVEKFVDSNYNFKKVFNLFITVDEFKKCLQKLYDNDYILVDIFDVYKQVYREGNFKVQRQDFKIPRNKKPIILFVDDLDYNSYMLNCTSSKLWLDETENKIKSVVIENGKEVLKDDCELISVLNNFIEKNPDFSFNNAKGIISLTGAEGVFGYNTGKDSKRNLNNDEMLRRLSKDILDARKIADKLKKDGWRFACHTYEHINFKNVTVDYIRNDIENWFKYVSNIVGNTNIFVYPYGNSIDPDDERFKYLNSVGFNVFCSSRDNLNKDSFTLNNYINIYRNLVSYEMVNFSKKDFYKIFEDVFAYRIDLIKSKKG